MISAPLSPPFFVDYSAAENEYFAQQERELAVEQALDTIEAADYFKDAEPSVDTSHLAEDTLVEPPPPTRDHSATESNAFEPREQHNQSDQQNIPSGHSYPDWLKRTSFGTVIESNTKPRVYLETVQPIFQTPDMAHTVLTQGRVSISGGNEDYSAGLGYRRLIANNTLLLGINNFFDYKSLNRHYRTGLGLEAISKSLEFRANSYWGLSGKRLIEENGPIKTYERAATGFDVEAGGPILPASWGEKDHDNSELNLSWLKIFGGYYWYDFTHGKDVSGWKVRGEIKPLSGIGLNLSVLGNKNDDPTYQLDLRVHLLVDDFRPGSIVSAIKSAAIPASFYTPLENRTLERVERSYDVKVERWSEGAISTPPTIITSVGNLTNVQLIVVFPGTDGFDVNSNGVVNPGDSFELDVFATNDSASNSTGISFANAAVTAPASISFNTSSNLPNASSGGTSITNRGTDLDILVAGGANAGDQLYVTLDMTADGETRTLTFGPFTVGSIVNGQMFDQI